MTKSEIVYSETGSCPKITTFGTVANKSDIPWKDLQIEVKYFDANGRLVDAHAEQAYRSFVPAGGEGVFRLQMSAAREEEAYARHEVIVHYAKYGGGIW